MKVYTYGVFDLFHYGHLRALREAEKLGDELVVGVFTDEAAESFKRKPILSTMERLMLISELGFTVKVQYEQDPHKTAKEVGADIIAKGPGAGFEDLEEKDIKLKLLEYTSGISTSDILKRIYARSK